MKIGVGKGQKVDLYRRHRDGGPAGDFVEKMPGFAQKFLANSTAGCREIKTAIAGGMWSE
jgi:hypothetical protein